MIIKPLLTIVSVIDSRLSHNYHMIVTCCVQAHAIVETTKTAHRVKMAILFHAPCILVPYTTDTQEGSIHVNLGDFSLSNKYDW